MGVLEEYRKRVMATKKENNYIPTISIMLPHIWPKGKTMLEDAGLTPESVAEQYHEAVELYVNDQITHEVLMRYMSSRNVIPGPIPRKSPYSNGGPELELIEL